MATENPYERSTLLCPKCKNLLNEPRIGRCGHSYCKSCLEEILKAIPQGPGSGGDTGRIMFQCPQVGCENLQYSIASASIEHFPANIELQRKVEDSKVQEKETICQKHHNSCKLFCKEPNCMREICLKCIADHPRHLVIEKEEALSEYIGKCGQISEQIGEELKGIEGNKKAVETLIGGEENKLAEIVFKLLEVFTAAEATMANEEVECITKALQELEFKVPARTQLALECRAAPLRYIQRIGRPILKNPTKNLKEPVIVIQAAEFAITSYKSKKDGEKLPMEMKAPVEDFNFMKHFFLSRISEKYQIGVLFLLN